jgi:predicted enzyme related to lactoylglutathione lyase
MIRWTTVFIDRPADGFDATRDFWFGATASTLSPTRGEHDEFATLLPVTGDACLRLQRTLDGSAGSHIDLHVDDVRVAAAGATDLGATVVEDLDTLAVMRSPGGLSFCLVVHDGEHERPTPVGAPGARTLVDQVSIDVAPDRFEHECRFWADLTGWALRPGSAPEYAVLERPEGQPFRFLLQRRGEADAGEPTLCHLDLACDDIPTSVAEHVALGASVVAPFRRWTVMADPAGVEYCLTCRNPDTGVPG